MSLLISSASRHAEAQEGEAQEGRCPLSSEDSKRKRSSQGILIYYYRKQKKDIQKLKMSGLKDAIHNEFKPPPSDS